MPPGPHVQYVLGTRTSLGRSVRTQYACVATQAAWSFTTPIPEGTFFATVFPLTRGIPPQTLFGSLVRPSTPPVPADMLPLARPAKESFVALAGTADQMPANGP